ncbi:cytochrome c biogenesis protein [Anaerosinus massiliensis]|uniref:cytochrome c biogenesis protein n=1 Tax=Massilibacillus massiliensis TaxID=1806837 RepID=UPI000B12B868|nr:cytochrome c biogenesis protein [Massilibacillus massiliensis]
MLNSLLTFYTLCVLWAVFYLVPPAEGLGYLVRIAFFHIPVAWVSVLAFLLSAWYALRYLNTKDLTYDHLCARSAYLGLIFCLFATISGAIFAKLTWGAYWNWDPRQITIFILLMIYGAYTVLRSSIEDQETKAKLSAVYSLLSFVTVPFLVFIIPRYYFSLHPSPVMNQAGKLDMDPIMVYVLLAALINCTLLFLRILFIHKKQQDLLKESSEFI